VLALDAPAHARPGVSVTAPAPSSP
jgi:hypothetical protein